MDMNFVSMEDREAASAVAALAGAKRGREEDDLTNNATRNTKLGRSDEITPDTNNMVPTSTVVPGQQGQKELQPYPFFFYEDFSTEKDPDPLTPLTPPGRVPNFPAKMHSILSRTDLSDIIAWMPHGRSWRVLKPREFEIRIIPTYFEHAKFSSFIRYVLW
jgi:HSF-type DNA-binding